MNDSRETIFALSSAPGRAGVAVFRISGPQTAGVLEAMVGALPAPRRAALREISVPHGSAIDSGLVLWFPGPFSFTGEDMAELQVHGSVAVAQALVAVLQDRSGCRPAEAGEFARRAFRNHKLDLAEIEGLADLIDAETEQQRKLAVRQAGGGLSRRIEAWRADLVRALAFLEAFLDFPEEDDLGARNMIAEVAATIGRIDGEVDRFLADNRVAERVRNGVRVVIAGPPNSGKSTLLNALARRDAAIVSDIAGTTRDVMEVHLDLGGYPVVLVDTAGLRAADNTIEEEGVRRANIQIETADIVIAMHDAAVPDPGGAADSPAKPNIVPVAAKWDLVADIADIADGGTVVAAGQPDQIRLSVHTGQGMDVLLDRLETMARDLCGGGDTLLARARHRDALLACQDALRRFLQSSALPAELRAEELRHAVHALGRITGRVDVEDLLDVVFRDFCIGK